MAGIVTEDLPEGVPLVAKFNHEYNRLDHYYPRLRNADIPTPDTAFFNVDVEDGTHTFDEGEISSWMVRNDTRHAFVRGMYASAKINMLEGSHLHSQDRLDIRETVSELIRQHIVMERPLGGRIAVREMVDLNYCSDPDCQNYHPNEVRYFIEDGRIDYRFPSEEKFVEKNRECENLFSYVDEGLDDYSHPDSLAYEVAQEFRDLSWSVDFVRDAKTGAWYCTDMGLNGLYYNEITEEWVSISEHDEGRGPEQYIDEMEERMWRGTFDGVDWLQWAEENAE